MTINMAIIFLQIASLAELRFYQTTTFIFFIAILGLYAALLLSKKKNRLLKAQLNPEPEPRPQVQPRPAKQAAPPPPPPLQPAKPAVMAKVSPKQLPDPGLVYKYSLAEENILEKTITVGQDDGTIRTYSTEIVNDHLSIYIRIIDSARDRSIYDIPGKIHEEYMLDIRRGGKTLIFYPPLKQFQEMDAKMRIYIQEKKDDTGELTFGALDPNNPIRFRLGDRLNQDGKFIKGFFEFHLFTKDYEVKTKAGIPKIEKNFFLRVFKIYPGYDTANVTSDGLYPMIDPFTTR